MGNEVATLANGCFWCTEAIFKRLKGVTLVKSGYSGGDTDNPNYEQVSSGTTGYAESLQIEFDPLLISFEKLLDVFWYTHDPTTLNKQGNDIGTQYRSIIFYHDITQQQISLKSKENLEKQAVYKDAIVTEITPFTNFYEAENYHKNYFDKNKDYPYCKFIIDPKIKKLLEKYSTKIKDEYKS